MSSSERVVYGRMVNNDSRNNSYTSLFGGVRPSYDEIVLIVDSLTTN